jgi:hypothetical protein
MLKGGLQFGKQGAALGKPQPAGVTFKKRKAKPRLK